MNENYIFASSKDWCVDAYRSRFEGNPNWFLVRDKSELTSEFIERVNPKYIFFPHWNWLVPESITQRYNCVCFHMADVPYGRGGSPLQNLISRGHKSTKLTALRMTRELDAGPVYTKAELSLAGSATEIFQRAAPKVIELILEIISNDITPKKQIGEVVNFKRRTPEQSEIIESMNTSEMYDFIRMLDAEIYPRAFINYGNHRIEFSDVKKEKENSLTATVKIFSKEEME